MRLIRRRDGVRLLMGVVCDGDDEGGGRVVFVDGQAIYKRNYYLGILALMCNDL